MGDPVIASRGSVCSPGAFPIRKPLTGETMMEGYTPDTSTWYGHDSSNRAYYFHTRDVDKLMHPDAVLCETTEELVIELKNRYPDVEEGYGQVIKSVVYNTPGLTSTDPEIAERVCKKYGKIPNHASFHPSGIHGFVIGSSNEIRYDEKIKKKRSTVKASATKRNHNYFKQLIWSLSLCEYESKYPTITQCLKTCHINLGTTVTNHQRVLFLTEMLMAATDDGKALHCEQYQKLAAGWAESVDDPKLCDVSALKTILLLATLFSRKESPAKLAG